MIRPLTLTCVLALAVSPAVGQPATAQGRPGVLLMAHGGAPEWNQRVERIAADARRHAPVEVAFGMASRASLQGAIDRLVAAGVTEVVAVPLFVSSWSSVITSTEFLLGLRAEAPADLAIFAKMDHSRHGAAAGPSADHAGHAGHAGHPGTPAPDPTTPVDSPVPVRMTSALNRHPLVGAILVDRARAVSASPADEAVVLVAHGPVPDDDNRRWLDDMAVLAGHVRDSAPYAAVHYLTVRDDAGPALREAATRELRELVTRESAAGRRVLVVPHLLSFGGIERGILKRLEGLDYTMAEQALIPDARILDWVLLQAGLTP